MRTIEHWVGGAFTPGTTRRYADVYDPARGVAQARVVLGTRDDVDAAAARTEFSEQVSPGLDTWSFRQPLLDHVRPDMSVYRDEVVGPLLVVLRHANEASPAALSFPTAR
jgi:acyl-CoA reductase-like NAD-dependent aldehyde dehydrogenase